MKKNKNMKEEVREFCSDPQSKRTIDKIEKILSE